MFDGAASPNNDYVTTSYTFNYSTGFSAEAWIKTSATNSPVIITDSRSSSHSGIWFGFTGSKLYCYGNKGTAGTGNFNVSSAKTVTDNVWHHVACTWDGTTNTNGVKLYVDGQQDGSTTALATVGAATYSLYIGQDRLTANDIYSGVLDTLRLYSRALTASEILANYQAGNIEFQTRTSADNSTWEAWKPTTNEAAIDAVDTLSPVQKISTTNLVAYWNLDETSGTRAKTAGSCTSCDLTDTNTVGYAPGRLKNAAQFLSANSEYLSVTDNADLSTGDIDFSIAGWVKIDATPPASRYILTKGIGASSNLEYALIATDTNKFQFHVSSDGSTTTAVTTTNTFSTSQWYFLVAWHDATANTINIQMNGGTADSAAYTTGSADRAGAFYLATEATSTYLNMTLDEFAFWKRTLTADERARLYQDGLDVHGAGSGRIYRQADTTTKIEGTGSEKLQIGAPQVDTSTVGLWHMEETSGTGAYIQDATANANHGTPTGTTVVDGFYGKGRSFDGVDDYVKVTNAVSLNTQSALTYSYWIKANSFSTTPIILNNHIQNVGSPVSGVVTSIGTDNKLAFQLRLGNVCCQTLYSNSLLSPSTWYHVTNTWDGSTMRIYINGQLDNSLSASGTLQVNRDTYIGINADEISRSINANQFNGIIDEINVSNVARSAEEIAEAYRAGRDHRVEKTITSTDLSAKSKLPFYIAADRPGTFLEATVGESAYANYSADANTIGLWHFEEQLDASGSIKDSSGLGNNLSLTSAPPFIQGKIGKARDFDGSADYASCTDANCGGTSKLDYTGSGGWSFGAWFKSDVADANFRQILTKDDTSAGNSRAYGLWKWNDNTVTARLCANGACTTGQTLSSSTTIQTATWYHAVAVYDASNLKIYVNGKLENSASYTSGINNSTADFQIGAQKHEGIQFWDGAIDAVFVTATALTADEIRQAYEIGKRTHPVTIGFAAKGDAGNLITGSTDYLFTVDGTGYGFQNKGDNLFAPDKIVVRENVGGTEYVAQGDVSAVTPSTGAVTVASWDSGSTFPAGGYTANASFFKWQREMFDLTGSLAAQRDAVTRLTLRVTNGNEGRTVWLDDFKSSSGYINRSTCDTLNTTTGECTYTIPAGSVTSTLNRYFQERIIISTSDTAVSPILTASQIEFGL